MQGGREKVGCILTRLIERVCFGMREKMFETD